MERAAGWIENTRLTPGDQHSKCGLRRIAVEREALPPSRTTINRSNVARFSVAIDLSYPILDFTDECDSPPVRHILITSRLRQEEPGEFDSEFLLAGIDLSRIQSAQRNNVVLLLVDAGDRVVSPLQPRTELRNWDLLALFLLVPGFLLLQEAHAYFMRRHDANFDKATKDSLKERGQLLLFWGYVWLIAGSGLWFARCLFDLPLVRRPVLAPNLNLSGLAWLAGALFICTTVVAVRRMPDVPVEQIGKGSIVLMRAGGRDGGCQLSDRISPARKCRCEILGRALDRDGAAPGRHRRAHPDRRGAFSGCDGRHGDGVPLYFAPIHGLSHSAGASRLASRVSGLGGLRVSQADRLRYSAWSSGWHYVLPAASLPAVVWLLPGSGPVRFSVAFLLAAVMSLSMTALVLWSRGEFSQHLSFARATPIGRPGSTPAPRASGADTHWAYRIPVFIVYMAFVVLTSFGRRPGIWHRLLPKPPPSSSVCSSGMPIRAEYTSSGICRSCC